MWWRYFFSCYITYRKMLLLFSLAKCRSYLRPQTRLRCVFAHGGCNNDLAVAILACASYQQHLPWYLSVFLLKVKEKNLSGCSLFSLKLILVANCSTFWLLAFIKSKKVTATHHRQRGLPQPMPPR